MDESKPAPSINGPQPITGQGNMTVKEIAAGTSQTAQSSRTAAVWTHLIAAVLLAALLAGGAYVTSQTLLVDDRQRDYGGYGRSLGQFTWGIYLPAQSWNIGVTIIGTVVGIITSLAITTQDDFATRRALASEGGCPAIYLRPLTVKRGAQQIARGMLSAERTLLFILMSGTAIMSATTIAVFSIQQQTVSVLNPRASYPLQDLDTNAFFRSGLGFYSPAGSYGTGTGALGLFMYKAAYINALKARGVYNPDFQYAGQDAEYIQEAGQIGFTAYPDLWTGGIGLNVASYTHRTGNPIGFALPPSAFYTLDSLDGDVYGTRVNVTCKEVSEEYSSFESEVEDVNIQFAAKPGGPNITTMWDAGYGKSWRSLAIGTQVWGISDTTSDPTLTVAIGRTEAFGGAWVAECTYTGHEYVTSLRLASPDDYISFGPDEKHTLSEITPKHKQDIVNATSLIMQQGMGGQLARGFIDADYNEDAFNLTGVVPVLETVFSQVGEAYISLLRQSRAEFSNVDPSPGMLQPDNKSFMNIRITVRRLGGASYGWLAVYGVFFLSCIMGLARIYSRAKTIGFEAQDSVALIANVYDPSVDGKTRLRFDNGLAIAGRPLPAMDAARAESDPFL